VRSAEICERSDSWGRRGESLRPPVPPPFFFETKAKRKWWRGEIKSVSFLHAECGNLRFSRIVKFIKKQIFKIPLSKINIKGKK